MSLRNYMLIVTLIIGSCTHSDRYQFTEQDVPSQKNFNLDYSDFCNLDLQGGLAELNAVQCSFYGDYKNSIEQATKDAGVQKNPFSNISISGNGVEAEKMRKEVELILSDENADEESTIIAEKLLNILEGPDNAKDAIKVATLQNAVDFIIENAKNHHLTLINEAHYCSQNRNFTERLLQPLWQIGYRYLALETFSHQDTMLQKRGYPILSSGFYTRDPNLGNVVREALKLGYKMIPYETQNGNDGTARDFDQTNNIYNKTYAREKEGKVLIHAGYSHISEYGDQVYKPLGYQLKLMVGEDILTIDQVEMLSLYDEEKMHPYYKFADSLYQFDYPAVLLDDEGNSVIDPVKMNSIDIQVYHPKTIFENGRPNWRKNKSNSYVELPKFIKKYEGHLIQAMLVNERDDAIPIDKFIIDKERKMILPNGNYKVQIIDCAGTLLKQLQLKVENKSAN